MTFAAAAGIPINAAISRKCRKTTYADAIVSEKPTESASEHPRLPVTAGNIKSPFQNRLNTL